MISEKKIRETNSTALFNSTKVERKLKEGKPKDRRLQAVELEAAVEEYIHPGNEPNAYQCPHYPRCYKLEKKLQIQEKQVSNGIDLPVFDVSSTVSTKSLVCKKAVILPHQAVVLPLCQKSRLVDWI